MSLEAQKLDQNKLKADYPAVYESNKERFARIAKVGDNTVRIKHNGQWLEVLIKGA